MKKFKKKRFAMFNKDEWGNIIGFCNDSFCMSYRYHCVNIWDYPPKHYFHPELGDFIICIDREYPDVRVLPLTKENHTFKGNYYFEQKYPNGEWHVVGDRGQINIGAMKK